MLVTISLPPPRKECQSSVNDFWSCIINDSKALQWHTSIIAILATFIGKNASNNFATTFSKLASTEYQWCFGLHHGYSHSNGGALTDNRSIGSLYVQKCKSRYCNRVVFACHIFNFRNLHAMSHRSDLFLAGSSKVNIEDSMLNLTISNILSVTQIELPRSQYPTTMWNTKYLKTLLLEVMISSENECVFICDLCDLTLQIILNEWWASMNVGSKQPMANNNSRHAPLWQFCLHCGIEETGFPIIIWIVCRQVLRHPSEHGTSTMGKHLLAKVHIAKLNELTVSEVTELTSLTLEETSLAIPKRKGSRGIPIVNSQLKFKFNI